ncbi:sulfotransferase [Streptomyces sp. NPDC050095]|uniref:sulfotransferase family protein n=1 Tax=unclassified Streptomyces TaxID=2593676 RepID=UPI0034421F7E
MKTRPRGARAAARKGALGRQAARVRAARTGDPAAVPTTASAAASPHSPGRRAPRARTGRHSGFREAVATWSQALAEADKWRAGLGSSRWHEVRFEDLIADPEGQLHGICGFLGESYAAEMCEPHRMAAVAEPTRKTWHVHIWGEPDASPAGIWATRLTPDQVRLCDAVLGDRLASRGYAPAGSVRPDPAGLSRYRKVAARRRAAYAKRGLVDRAVRLRERGALNDLRRVV